MAELNYLKISEMLASLDSRQVAEQLAETNPDLDPNAFDNPEPAAPEQPTNNLDAFMSALAVPDSGIQPPPQIPQPNLFGFGRPHQAVPPIPGQALPNPFTTFGGR